jgi:hypothetical protein
MIRQVYAGVHDRLDDAELRLLAGFLGCVMDKLGFSVLEEEGPSTGCRVQHVGRLDVCEDIYIVSDVDENSYVGPAVVVHDFINQEVWPDATAAGAEHFPLMFYMEEGRDTVDERVERSLNIIRSREILLQLEDPVLQDVEDVPDLIEDEISELEERLDFPKFICIVC